MLFHRHWLLFTIAALLSVTAVSCRQTPPPPPAAAPARASTNLQIFQVKGVIQELQPEKKRAKITHEEIPDYMEAMTMMFDVKDVKELAGLQPGDAVSFRMSVTDDDGWIDQVKKLDGPRTPLPSPAPPMRRVREVEPLAVGDAVPEYSFTNTLGRVMRLGDFKGRAVALTFIFTRCPFPTFCPRLSTGFLETQTKLKALPNAPTNWHLLSITIDPAYDTLDKLQTYAAQYKADPQRWDFVTGDLTDITAISEQFGLQFWRANPSEPINHNVRTVVLDATGRVQWITPETDWKSDDLVEQMVKAARAKPAP